MTEPGIDLAGSEWQRLDPRMLLVHPVREVGRFLPVLLGLFVAGSASGGGWLQYAGAAVPVLLGLLRYLTTRFRIAHGRVELRRGLVSRHTLSVPVDRVRTVDLTSSLVHRVLGLTTARIGTGTASTDSDDAVDLDGLPLARARRLREDLLRASAAAEALPAAETAPEPERPLLRLDPRWARYAPLTGSGVAIAAGVLGVASQVLSQAGGIESLDVRGAVDRVSAAPVWVAVPVLTAGVLAAVSALAVTGYLVTNWGFTLTGSPRAWHLRRGLLTTRETTLDRDRIAGVDVTEPLGLRAAGAGRVSARVTGLGASQQGSSVLVPPAPYAVVAGVAGEVLGTSAPLTVPLTTHGPQATRRRWTRAVGPALLVAALLVAAVVVGDWSRWWLLAAGGVLLGSALLAADRSRSLGHALVEDHLVARAGSVVRRREVLHTSHVIGWVLRDTWLQRRAGLTSLVAATAGGDQAVVVTDVPGAEALRVAGLALPGLVEQFLEGQDQGPQVSTGS